jgi:hypothetical protein
MKCVLVTVLCLFSAAAHAQQTKAPIEPARTSTFYYLDSSAHLVALESQTALLTYIPHRLATTTKSKIYRVNGSVSPIRLATDLKPEFVVRFQPANDAAESVWLARFESSGGFRTMPLTGFDTSGRVSTVNYTRELIGFNAAQYGGSSTKIVPIEPLAPGEYCFISSHMPKKTNAFCFGVEGGNP